MASDTISTCTACRPLKGELSVPGDKSISHRVAILAGLAAGSARIRNFLRSADCLRTLEAMRQLGAVLTPSSDPDTFTLTGTGMRPAAPREAIDCGNSGTGMRLLAGVLSALPFRSRLEGDASLSRRPMRRIITPLELMGASIRALGETEGCAPLEISGGALTPICYTLPMASAQVKSAVLLAALFAPGETTVVQPVLTRDHTERLLRHFGVPCAVSEDGLTVSLRGPAKLQAHDIDIPADFSSAAFWIAAAAIVPGSELTLRGVGLNPTRTALSDVLRRMGVPIEVTRLRTSAEPSGDITVRYAEHLHGTELTPSEIPNIIDEIPILSVIAAFAEGQTHIRRAAELRVKESDRIASVVRNLRAMGAEVREFDDGMCITGASALTGTSLDSFSDHRIAMSFLIAGLRASGTTTLHRCADIETSYPGFEAHLRQLTT